MKEIDGVPIDRLVEEYGSPIFIVSEQTLRNNLKAFREEFSEMYKKKEELRKAVKEGALINVDHIDELKLLEEIACELRRTLEVGIRINADVGIHQLLDR